MIRLLAVPVAEVLLFAGLAVPAGHARPGVFLWPPEWEAIVLRIGVCGDGSLNAARGLIGPVLSQACKDVANRRPRIVERAHIAIHRRRGEAGAGPWKLERIGRFGLRLRFWHGFWFGFGLCPRHVCGHGLRLGMAESGLSGGGLLRAFAQETAKPAHLAATCHRRGRLLLHGIFHGGRQPGTAEIRVFGRGKALVLLHPRGLAVTVEESRRRLLYFLRGLAVTVEESWRRLLLFLRVLMVSVAESWRGRLLFPLLYLIVPPAAGGMPPSVRVNAAALRFAGLVVLAGRVRLLEGIFKGLLLVKRHGPPDVLAFGATHGAALGRQIHLYFVPGVASRAFDDHGGTLF